MAELGPLDWVLASIPSPPNKEMDGLVPERKTAFPNTSQGVNSMIFHGQLQGE